MLLRRFLTVNLLLRGMKLIVCGLGLNNDEGILLKMFSVVQVCDH